MIYKEIKIWLLVGLVMVLMQIVIGSATRLTESGLSITKWEVITGTLPPLSDADWEKEFNLYKESPQYKEINEGMSMSDFKYIYYWEYVHRLWARLMGFVFIIPFIFFYIKKKLSRDLLKNLIVVLLLASLAAIFGWVMVASGLISRPWVNAYKLSIHLILGFSVFLYLLFTFINYVYKDRKSTLVLNFNNVSFIILLLWIQIFLGGAVSGMKSAVMFPTWPDMNGAIVPGILLELSKYTVSNFLNYDSNELMPALIHFLHRLNAYVVAILIIIFVLKNFNKNGIYVNYALLYFVFVLVLQIILGILTVIYSIGEVPVLLGVLHQVGALGLISGFYLLRFYLKGDVKV